MMATAAAGFHTSTSQPWTLNAWTLVCHPPPAARRPPDPWWGVG